MRVLLVLCLAFAFVAEEAASTSAESTLSCIRGTLRASIDASRKNTESFLEQLSPKGDIKDVSSQIKDEYALLQQKLDESTDSVVKDFVSCEERNKGKFFKQNCALMAKMSFAQKGMGHVMAHSTNSLAIITRANVDFAKQHVLQKGERYLREQSEVLLSSLRQGTACFRNGY